MSSERLLEQLLNNNYTVTNLYIYFFKVRIRLLPASPTSLTTPPTGHNRPQIVAEAFKHSPATVVQLCDFVQSNNIGFGSQNGQYALCAEHFQSTVFLAWGTRPGRHTVSI